MEKAFDRVSYEFTKKGLEAFGFGKGFRKWVGMMYDENKAPRRRMYVNGYYSDWFEIKSGVAQGFGSRRISRFGLLGSHRSAHGYAAA